MEECLLFCGRYRFTKSVPQYASATCEVWFALDVHSLEHAFGSKWKEAGSEKPLTGAEIKNASLSAALQGKIEFTISEWEDFRVSDISYNSYIKAGDCYFKSDEHAGDTGGSPTEKSVCLKIMKNQDEYDREIASRKGINTQYVVEIDKEESERVTKEFAVNIHKLPRQSNFFPTETDYKTKAGEEEKPLEAFCLVMECGECNFGEMLKNRKLAGDRIRLMEPLHDIAKFLSHLHEKDLVHCDVKAQNVVRMASGEIKGIDLDGAATEDEGLFGTKTSSAFLPPECVGLDNDSKAYYIKSAANTDEVLSLPLSLALALSRECAFARIYTALLSATQPASIFSHIPPDLIPQTLSPLGKSAKWDHKAGKSVWAYECVGIRASARVRVCVCVCVSKTACSLTCTFMHVHIYFHACVSGLFGPCFTHVLFFLAFSGLQGKTMKAQRTIDIWQFGTLLYRAMAGKDLFPANDHDNLADVRDLTKIYHWTDATKEDKLADVNDHEARELLYKILCKDPRMRPQSFKTVLQDDFFQIDGNKKGVKQTLNKLRKNMDEVKEGQARIEKGIIELKHLAKETLEQVRRSEEVLRKAVFESTEIRTPTCFVILPNKLGDHMPENAEHENAEMQEHLQGIAEEALCFTEEAEGGEDEEGGEEGEGLEESQKGSSKSAIGRAQRKLMLVKKRMDKWLNSKIYDKPVYLYLVDELTGMPMDGDSDQPTYPIEITSPKEKLRELVPLMCLGITAMSLVSNGGGLARMFGIPVPKLSSTAKGSMRAFANKMSKANSAEQFDCLQASIGDAKQSDSTVVTKQIRGKALRKICEFPP